MKVIKVKKHGFMQSKCCVRNGSKATHTCIRNKNIITKDCNVVLPKLDTKVFNTGKKENTTLKVSKSKDAENRKNTQIIYNDKSKIIMNGEGDIEHKGEHEMTAVLTKSDTRVKSSLERSIIKKVVKRVRFKIPIAKYRIIKPLKKRNMRKLLVMLTRCDETVKN